MKAILFGLETALLSFESGSDVLFDTPFARGEEGIPINGLVWMGSYDEMLTRLEEKMKAGFRCVKLKIGAIDFDKELDLIRHIRSAFTKDQIELRVDANGGFTPDNAMERLEQLARFDIHSIEQPRRIRAQHVVVYLARKAEHVAHRIENAFILWYGITAEVWQRRTLSHALAVGLFGRGYGYKPRLACGVDAPRCSCRLFKMQRARFYGHMISHCFSFLYNLTEAYTNR